MNSSFLIKIRTLAFSVWRESIRDKAVTILITAFVVIMLFFHIMGTASINSDRLIQTAGLYSFGIFGILSNIYLSINFIQELNDKRFYIILVRPVTTFQFLAGKYIGMCILLLTVFMLMTFIWLLLIMSNNISITYLHALTLLFVFAEWILISSASLFFALFTNPLLQSLLIASLYFFGHHSNDIYIYSQTSNNIITQKILIGLYYAIPNLELLNFRSPMLYGETVSIEHVLSSFFITGLWILVFFTAACTVFLKKRFV